MQVVCKGGAEPSGQSTGPKVLILVVVAVVDSKVAVFMVEIVKSVRATKAAVRKTHSTDTAPVSSFRNGFSFGSSFIATLFFACLSTSE